MKIPFTEIANRITGISTPVFGVSWNPPTLDSDIAKKLLTFFEDRRVLYRSPYHLENLEYTSESILQIRTRLTQELERLDRSSPLAQSITAMRAACRKFLDHEQAVRGPIRRELIELERRIILSALGEFRGVFGIHIAQIAVRYGVDLEEQLAEILPGLPDSDTR